MEDNALKILLVDDDKDIIEICAETFELEGFEVEVALSVGEALEKYKPNHFHVIISDYNMPGKSGAELLKAIRAMDSEVYFYITTGSVMKSDEEMKSLGATGLFTKPYSIEDLINEVKSKADS